VSALIDAMINLLSWLASRGITQKLLLFEADSRNPASEQYFSGLNQMYHELLAVFWLGISVVILLDVISRVLLSTGREGSMQGLARRSLVAAIVATAGEWIWFAIFELQTAVGAFIFANGASLRLYLGDSLAFTGSGLVGTITLAAVIYYVGTGLVAIILIFWLILIVRLLFLCTVFVLTPILALMTIPQDGLGGYMNQAARITMTIAVVMLMFGVIIAAVLASGGALIKGEVIDNFGQASSDKTISSPDGEFSGLEKKSDLRTGEFSHEQNPQSGIISFLEPIIYYGATLWVAIFGTVAIFGGFAQGMGAGGLSFMAISSAGKLMQSSGRRMQQAADVANTAKNIGRSDDTPTTGGTSGSDGSSGDGWNSDVTMPEENGSGEFSFGEGQTGTGGDGGGSEGGSPTPEEAAETAGQTAGAAAGAAGDGANKAAQQLSGSKPEGSSTIASTDQTGSSEDMDVDADTVGEETGDDDPVEELNEELEDNAGGVEGFLRQEGERLEAAGEYVEEEGGVMGVLENADRRLRGYSDDDGDEPMEGLTDEDVESMDEVDADTVDELKKQDLEDKHVQQLTRGDVDSVEDFDFDEDGHYIDEYGNKTDRVHEDTGAMKEFDSDEVQDIEDLKEEVRHDDWETAKEIQERRNDLKQRGYTDDDVQDMTLDKLKDTRKDEMRENLRDDGLEDEDVHEMEGTYVHQVDSLNEEELDHLEKQRDLGPHNPDKSGFNKAYGAASTTMQKAASPFTAYAQAMRLGGVDGIAHMYDAARQASLFDDHEYQVSDRDSPRVVPENQESTDTQPDATGND
jgi:hypothetical protein